MSSISDERHSAVDRVVDQLLERFQGAFLAGMEVELVLDSVRSILFCGNVFYVRVEHQVNQIDDYVGLFSQCAESLSTEVLEVSIVGAVRASHKVDHRLVDSHGRRLSDPRFGILSKDVSKVDVEDPSVVCDQQVVQMPVSDAQNVGNHAVAGFLWR